MAASLSTAHLELAPLALAPAHESLYVALYTDPRVMARIAAPLESGAAARAFRRTVAANAVPGARRTWAVAERSTGTALGIAALLPRTHDIEMGLMLLPRGWNARYSHEVIDALVAHAFDDLGVDRLTGICQAGPAERMSRRLLTPHGFVDAAPDREGTARWVLERGAWSRPVGSTARDG